MQGQSPGLAQTPAAAGGHAEKIRSLKNRIKALNPPPAGRPRTAHRAGAAANRRGKGANKKTNRSGRESAKKSRANAPGQGKAPLRNGRGAKCAAAHAAPTGAGATGRGSIFRPRTRVSCGRRKTCPFWRCSLWPSWPIRNGPCTPRRACPGRRSMTGSRRTP